MRPPTSEISSKLYIYCDGGARGNPGPAAIGIVIKDNKGKSLHTISQSIGETTNNIAEYQAVIAALKYISKLKIKKNLKQLTIFLDSKLVVNQLMGEFKIKNVKLKRLVEKVNEFERILGVKKTGDKPLLDRGEALISYHFIPRTANSQADALVNQALDAPQS